MMGARRWHAIADILNRTLYLTRFLPLILSYPSGPAWAMDLPQMIRVDLAGNAAATRSVTLSGAIPGTRLLAITGDCRCVTVTAPLPLTVDASGRAEVTLRISGIQPGLHPLTVHTTAGTATLTVQVVGGGLGEGAAVLAEAVKQTRSAGGEALLVVHRLGNAVRQCGCSSGSLGGIDVLAALPGAWAAAGGGAARFVLSGEAGAGALALTAFGWTVGDPAISTDAADLAKPGMIVISADGPAHARRVTPLMDGGAIALVLGRDAAGALKATVALPIDRTLPRDGAILAGFLAPAVVPVEGAAPSQNCVACHQAAHTSWVATAHARAWTSLAEADRTEACASCHVTGMQQTAGGVAAHVHCQGCHTGAEAHAVAGGTVRTVGAVDCRSCHDAKHDPGFDPVAAWLRVQHGK
jgi:hypothetical protein